MENNFSRVDLDKVIKHLLTDDPKLTQGPLVKKFEEEWSKWLGVRFSVFVNSGSSANLLSLFALRQHFQSGGEVIVPPLTWSSDISSVLHSGFTPIFADISPKTLGMDTDKIIEKITDKTKAVFLTHCQGFNALTDKLLDFLDQRNIWLIEDVCESHGATHEGKKVGTFGKISNFSFYYAHHMSTIEGGMICTDDEDLYETLRMLRAHGMVRELNDNQKKMRIAEKNKDLNPDFIFSIPAFNVRNNEIGAILGLSQLERLDEIVELRTNNQKYFFDNLEDSLLRKDFFFDGSSNYAFNLILKSYDLSLSASLKAQMDKVGIENRRGSAGGGNQLRQPYLKRIFKDEYKKYPETEHIHFNGFYIGNFPNLTKKKLTLLVEFFNDFSSKY